MRGPDGPGGGRIEGECANGSLTTGCCKGWDGRAGGGGSGRVPPSVVGHSGNPGQANYAAAKAGLAGMTRSMAAEVAARGITVNCVAPGFIDTPMTDVLNDKQKDGINERIPAGRMGAPDDIAAAVAYLASNEAGYVTGQTLHVNGGMAML